MKKNKSPKNILNQEEKISGEEIARVDLAIIGPEIADRIISLRKQQGLSQDSLANKSGISRTTLKQIENAQKIMSLDEANSLALVLKVSPQYVIAGEEN